MANWWEIKNSTGEDDSPAELLIYGYIGEFDEVSSSDIVNKLKNISSNAINVKINSYGGSVFTAQAILSSLKRHKANILFILMVLLHRLQPLLQWQVIKLLSHLML